VKPAEEILIVDGYNMIGAWPELVRLKEHNLEEARDRLIDMLADYQGYSGIRVIVVFDAHQVPGLGAKLKQNRVTVHFTREKETADECIERLVAELSHRRRQIYVATSDSVEQRVTFGQGALRLSARELLIDVEQGRREIERSISERSPDARHTLDKRLGADIRLIFEQWRRK
jgi:hypothetical protein